METLELIKDPGILKLLGSDVPISLHDLEAITRKREIVYLKMADLSYHQIIDYFWTIHDVKITKYYIASVIREAGVRARRLNGIYDAKVEDRIHVIEIDEVYQGHLNCYLGVVDKYSHYLLVFARLEDRSIGSIKTVLEQLVDDLDGLELIITDALAAYKSVIPGVFEGIVHVLCHVHAGRTFLKEGEMIKRRARKAATALRDTRQALVKNKHDLRAKKRRLNRHEYRFTKGMNDRAKFFENHGIKPNSKTKKFTAERKSFNKNINYLRVCTTSLKNTLESLNTKIHDKESKIPAMEKEMTDKKQDAMQSGRLIHGFRRLLDCPPDAFMAELARYTAKLARSKYPIAKKIQKFIKNNPNVYATNLPEAKITCPLNLINTNTAEGTFSITRPFLTKAKHFCDSEQSGALLEILRLKYNMSIPFTGQNNHWSPLERAGVHSPFTSYLEALFPLPGERERHRVRQVTTWNGTNPSPVPSEGEIRENLARFRHVAGNLADRSPVNVKNRNGKKK